MVQSKKIPPYLSLCYGQPLSPPGNIVLKSSWEEESMEDKAQLDNLGNFNGSLCVPKFAKLYLDFFLQQL